MALGKTGLRAWARSRGCWLPLLAPESTQSQASPKPGSAGPRAAFRARWVCRAPLWKPACPGRSREAPGMGSVLLCLQGASVLCCGAEGTGSRNEDKHRGLHGRGPGWGWGEQRRVGRGCAGGCIRLPSAEEQEGEGPGWRWGLRAERTAPSNAVGARREATAGCGAPRLRTAGAGRSPWSPAQAEGARPWCPFRRLSAHGGLQHPQVGGQPPEPRQRQTQQQGGGLRHGPRQQERCVWGPRLHRAWRLCREGQRGHASGVVLSPAPQKEVTWNGFPAWHSVTVASGLRNPNQYFVVHSLGAFLASRPG